MVKVVAIEDMDAAETYDIWNKESDCHLGHGNFVIDGLVVHNSILANGVRCFEDLLFFNAAGHPGPMASIPEAVKNRDDARGSWRRRLNDIHPVLLEILQDTYGIILWQEQLAAIWQRLGGFTSPEAQDARKAVAKKWVDKLKPIGQKWLDGATPTIGRDNAEMLWEKMVTFGRYAFNRCLDKDVLLTDEETGLTLTVGEWASHCVLPTLKSVVDGQQVDDRCVAIHDTGLQEVFEITFDNGQIEYVTLDHQFLCADGAYHAVREIIDQGLDVVEAPPGQRDQ